MNCFFFQRLVTPVVFSAGLLCAISVHAAGLGYVEGRVLSKTSGKKIEPVQSGHALAADEVLITGDATRFEIADAGGLWRVGRRAVFSLNAHGARLLAGTALIQVPVDAVWQVSSRRSVLALPAGTWLVQAVENGGFKVICLDGAREVAGLGEPSQTAEPSQKPALLKLRPGELAFLQPGGGAFSPVVTIFLEELLATSRLIVGFPDELPGHRRITNQAIAQRDRLKQLSNAVVAGAPVAGSFQIAVPNPPESAKAGSTPAK